MEAKTLDEIVVKNNIVGSMLVKLDVQGHELNVLKGASCALKMAEVVIVEVSLIPLHESAPSPFQVINFFNDHGYRLFDMFGNNRRPCNKDLWQVDWVFVKKESNLGSPKFGW